MTVLLRTLAPSLVGHILREWLCNINCNKVKFSPLVQSGLEIPVFYKINLRPVKTNFARFAYSLEEDYDDHSTSIRKTSNTSDVDEVVECET